MEQIVNWKSPKKWLVFLFTIFFLSGLLLIANLSDPAVHFADPKLEQVIREKIGQTHVPIYRTGLLTITELDASGQGIKDLSGIEALHKLVVLNLENNSVNDLTPLAGLGMLSELNLQNNNITDLEEINFNQITNLPLRSLNLRNNVIEDGSRLSDIYLLSKLSQLEVLDLRDNQIRDIEPLRQLNNLRKLNLRGNQILDIQPLEGLTGLVYLNIHSNPINTGLDTLSNHVNLKTLIMANVIINDDFDFLKHLKNLQELNIRDSAITDLSPIGNLMQAGTLQDNSEANIYASINLLEINPVYDKGDPFQSLRRYWNNISHRYPSDLPYYPSLVEPPIFSYQSGFYKDSFYLKLFTDNPDRSIYYTLDGAEPSLSPQLEEMGSTQKYIGPILIQSKVGEPNLLSALITDKLNQHIPESEVFKGSVVRAIVVDETGNRSNVLTQTYFIDEQINTRYTLPVVSIATNADYLFDDEIGIYTLGDLYQNIDAGDPSRNPANFTQHGLKWERPISFEVFSPEGESLIRQNIGIRINGGFSRAYNPRALRLIAAEEYDEQGLIHYSFFPELDNRLKNGTVDTYETLVLRNAGNDVGGSLFRDAFAQNLLLNSGLDIQGSQPAVVFINGEYWGIYNIRTRYDKQYFQSYYGIKPDELLVLVYENGWARVHMGDQRDQAKYYSSLFSLIDEKYDQNGYITLSNLSEEKAYQTVAEKMDIDNTISYFASQIYFNNVDWPRNNVYLWIKTIDSSNIEPDLPYGHDGKWRWMVTDVDFGFGDPYQDSLNRILGELQSDPSTFLFRSLLENDGFKQDFINQFADQLNTTFREEVVASKVDEFEAIYYPEIEEHIHRWGRPKKTLDLWLRNVDEIRKFALLRPSAQRQQIVENFKLPGVATVKVEADPSQGYIRINTINITNDTVGVIDPAQWTGIYFQGVPVDITAIPQNGFRFVRWEQGGQIIPDSESPEISIVLEDDLNLSAIFTSDSATPSPISLKKQAN